MASLSTLIEIYLTRLKDSGLADEAIYFNQFQTMTVGGLLSDMLKFYPNNEHAAHQLTDTEELRLEQNFAELLGLLEKNRPVDDKPVVSKHFTHELNRFFERLDGIFAHLYGRDSNKFVFDPGYFKLPEVRQLFVSSVLGQLRGKKA